MHRILFLLTALIFTGCRSSSPEPEHSEFRAPQLTPQDSGTDALLVGVHAVSDSVVWISGTGGTFLRTMDGGASWTAGTVPGADTLQFRDVHGMDAQSAYLLSIGPGPASRVYRTVDGGQSWDQQFVSPRPNTFFDCFDFWPDGVGIGFSDAVNGRLPIIRSVDGQNWQIEEGPEALQGEGGFAASGTCLIALGDGTALIGTGNSSQSRVLRTTDRGETWEAFTTPIVSGEAAGVTTLAFRDDQHGVALGGHLAAGDSTVTRVAVTADGGKTWKAGGQPTFPGAIYGSSYVSDTAILVAVGPNGASYSTDDGHAWMPMDTLNYWSVDFSGRTGWAVGPEGRITQIQF